MAAAVFFLALTLIDFLPQLIEGRSLFWGDVGLYFLPMLSFLHENLRAGRLPLWNPNLLCGTPFVGNPQVWPFYPPAMLLPFVDASRFLSLTIAGHVWLAAVGTYLFLRRAETLSTRASCVGAVVFAFGGQLVSKEQFPNMVQAIAWLPWILYATHRLAQTWRITDAVRLGTLLGLQILAAHIQITLLTLYLSCAYGIVQSFSQPNRPRWPLCLGRLSAAGGIAAGLCAAQILPTLELYRDAWRQKLSFRIVDRFYLPPSQLANFVLPRLHGHPFFGDFSARGNFWETCCYVSVVGFILVAIGFWQACRPNGPRALRFWPILFVFGVWMAMGGSGGLYHLAYAVLPGFRSFHDPARCLLWSAWAACVLSAVAFQRLEIRARSLKNVWILFGLVFLGVFGDLVMFNRTLYPLATPEQLQQLQQNNLTQRDPIFAEHQARLLAPDSARVWQRFTTHRAYRQETPGYFAAWGATLTPNLPLLSGLPDAYGYEPVTRRDAQTVSGLTTAAFGPKATSTQRKKAAAWAGALSVRDIVFFRTTPPSKLIPGLAALESASTLPPLDKPKDAVRVYWAQNRAWQPRARLSSAYYAVSSRAEMLQLFSQGNPSLSLPDLAAKTIIVGDPSFPSGSPHRPTSASIISDAPDRVVVQATNAAPTLLVLADTLHPGWHATTDGRMTRILSADGFLRAVPLPVPGRHTVVFSYSPASFRVGLYVSLMTTSALLAFLVISAGLRRKIFGGVQESGVDKTNNEA